MLKQWKWKLGWLGESSGLNPLSEWRKWWIGCGSGY